MRAVGVDVGTTNSCVVSGTDISSLEPVSTGCANGVVPSYVSVGPTAVYCGEAARQRRAAHGERTFYEFKRTIARKWRQRALWNSTAKHLTFKLGMPKDPDQPPLYGATLNGVFVQLTSFDLYVHLLKHMLKDVTEPVVCVATVPAMFTGPQRQATKEAVEQALPRGSTVTTLNEPTAAAIAYTNRVDVAPGEHVLVLDVGGGTTDATLIRVGSHGSINVVRSKGDHEVGGAKLTDAVHTWAAACCKKQGYGKLVGGASVLLHDRCEEVKCVLSSVDEASIALTGVVVVAAEKEPQALTLTRAKFDDLIHNDVSTICEVATQTTGAETSAVKHVVLVGGATRTRLLREHIQNIYSKAALTTELNPETAVARGAAMQALDLIKQTTTAAAESSVTTLKKKPLPKLRSETLNASISVRVREDQAFVLVPHGTKLPHTCQRLFSPMDAKQRRMLLVLTQGEHKLSSNNDVLASYDIQEACDIELIVKVGFDGSVNVTANDAKRKKSLLDTTLRSIVTVGTKR
jgi:molecular chaperone DnaK (HSP70)